MGPRSTAGRPAQSKLANSHEHETTDNPMPVGTKKQNAEQIARDLIDAKLAEAGWIVQSKDRINFNAGQGVTVRKQTDNGSRIRRVCGLDKKTAPFAENVRRNFQAWILKRHSGGGQKFNDEQMEWLRMIRDHIAPSIHIDRDDLDMAPFDAKGGLGNMYQLFEESMETMLHEMNQALAA